MTRIIEQLAAPITMVNPEMKEEIIEVHLDTVLQLSGGTLTTPVNTEDNISIFEVWTALCSTLTNEDLVTEYRNAANYVGHTVEIEEVYELPHTQFLKHSFMKADSGRTVLTINSGAVVRSLGLVEGNLEPKHLGISREAFDKIPYLDKWKKYIASVVNSYVNEPADPFLTLLREVFPYCGHNDEERSGDAKYILSMSENFRKEVIPEKEWIRRYEPHGGTMEVWLDFKGVFSKFNVGYEIRHPMINAMLKADYGYSGANYWLLNLTVPQ